MEVTMGLFDSLNLDSLKGMIGQVAAAEGPALVSQLLAKSDLGGLQGIVDKLQQGGLGPQVQSWLGNGGNMPVSTDQIRSALGNPMVQSLAQQFGLPVDQVLKMLSDHLPAAVDDASPNGRL
jgi:uncharacterized protein YidB (DUF937 family)